MDKNLLRITLEQLIPHKREQISTYSIPSKRRIDIQLNKGATTIFTAPANGYVMLYAGLNGGIVQNGKNEFQSAVDGTGIAYFQGFTLASKGDTIQIRAADGTARFIYAEGSK